MISTGFPVKWKKGEKKRRRNQTTRIENKVSLFLYVEKKNMKADIEVVVTDLSVQIAGRGLCCSVFHIWVHFVLLLDTLT